MPNPLRTKICGITTIDDALQAVDAGADILGLNFYEKSSRFVSLQTAKGITEAIRAKGGNTKLCGVFVNATTTAIREILDQVRLDSVQLHGDEPPEFISELHSLLSYEPAFVRAFRVKGASLVQVIQYLGSCHEFGPHAILLDAHDPTAYGGTGKRLDWGLVRREGGLISPLPIILAGGLTPENVAKAIETARPDAVDVAGGVESAPGIKDPAKVAKFVAEARMAFDRLR